MLFSLLFGFLVVNERQISHTRLGREAAQQFFKTGHLRHKPWTDKCAQGETLQTRLGQSVQQVNFVLQRNGDIFNAKHFTHDLFVVNDMGPATSYSSV